MSILQGYDMEMRHIPGKINPAYKISRQVKSDDLAYSAEVKQLDSELVETIRIPVEASDADVQMKVDHLYNSSGTRDKLKQASKQVLTTDEDSFKAVLVVAEISIHVDNQFKRDLFNSLKEDDPYRELIQTLEDKG